MKPELTPVEKAQCDKIARDALDVGFDALRAAMEPHVDDEVQYKNWEPPNWVLRGPVKILDVKREGKRITHLKLADSPCWVKIEHILRG